MQCLRTQKELDSFLSTASWLDSSIIEIYGHPSIPSEQPSGASAAGILGLDLRILFGFPNEKFLEVVFDHAEFVSLSFVKEARLQGSIDSLGRFEGTLGFGNKNSIKAGRLRYRFVKREAGQELYFRQPNLLPSEIGDLNS
jgi:hypothetical protein